MNKILCLLMAMLALVAVIDCNNGVKDHTNQHDICSIVGCVNEQHHLRKKREKERAEDILGGIQSLVTNILDTTFENVGKLQKTEGEEIVIIGGGEYNENTVVFNDSDYE